MPKAQHAVAGHVWLARYLKGEATPCWQAGRSAPEGMAAARQGQAVPMAGRKDPMAQTAARWTWTGSVWTGTDFAVRPGAGIYLIVASSFTWTPALVTPARP